MSVAAVLAGRSRWTVAAGDCLALLPALPEASVDAIVTDPPYGLEFMGKEWDRFKVGRSASYAGMGHIAEASIPGTGFTRLPSNSRPAKRCAKCGRQAWSGSPCRCEQPEWTVDSSPSLAFQAWSEAWATEALRVLKPGGHLLAFGGTRTHHRLMVALEDAGFEIRDTCMWLYGSGFPKSLDVSKALDKSAGHWRGKRGDVLHSNRAMAGPNFQRTDKGDAVTAAAAAWVGWGTALKPAFEPIILARKPLAERNVAANVLTWRTGALNVDGCRVPSTGETIPRVSGKGILGGTGDGWDRPWKHDPGAVVERQARADAAIDKANSLGRWPANLVLTHDPRCVEIGTTRVKGNTGIRGKNALGLMNDHGWQPSSEGQVVGYADPDGLESVALWACVPGCPVRTLDEQSGERPGGTFPAHRNTSGYRGGLDQGPTPHGVVPMGDSGGASRFFYTAKADRAEREIGLDHNPHPTVKPVALMQWLVRLVTPPDGLVLDPFAGSGSTGIAALREGVRFLGLEQDAEYVALARARIIGDAPLLNGEDP